MARHVHADLIHQWAEGVEIERLVSHSHWVSIPYPNWFEDTFYRVAQPKQWPNLYSPKLAKMRSSQHSEYFSVAQSDSDVRGIKSDPCFIEWVK